MRFRPTLAQTFLAANVCLAALLGALVYGLVRGSERAVIGRSGVERSHVASDSAQEELWPKGARVRFGPPIQ